MVAYTHDKLLKYRRGAGVPSAHIRNTFCEDSIIASNKVGKFAYQPNIGVEDAIIFLTHRALSHLEKQGSTVRVMFFDFSSAFSTIQPCPLRNKLLAMHLLPKCCILDIELAGHSMSEWMAVPLR